MIIERQTRRSFLRGSTRSRDSLRKSAEAMRGAMADVGGRIGSRGEERKGRGK